MLDFVRSFRGEKERASSGVNLVNDGWWVRLVAESRRVAEKSNILIMLM